MKIETFKRFLKEEIKTRWNTFRIYLPLTKKIKQQALDEAQKKIDFYQPKIEKITKVSLGSIKAKDRKELYGEISRNAAVELFFKVSPMIYPLPAEPLVYLIHMCVQVPSIQILGRIAGIDTDMSHYDGNVYLNFYEDRKNSLLFRNNPKINDLSIVHELSHALWRQLEIMPLNKRNDSWRESLIWNEGFATYCSEVHFAEIYPRNAKRGGLFYSETYSEGFNRVKQLVAQNGSQALFDIPKNWRDFSKQFRK